MNRRVVIFLKLKAQEVRRALDYIVPPVAIGWVCVVVVVLPDYMPFWVAWFIATLACASVWLWSALIFGWLRDNWRKAGEIAEKEGKA